MSVGDKNMYVFQLKHTVTVTLPLALTWLLMDCVVGGGVKGLLTLPLGLKAMA